LSIPPNPKPIFGFWVCNLGSSDVFNTTLNGIRSHILL
jgi:hypothetical protein